MMHMSTLKDQDSEVHNMIWSLHCHMCNTAAHLGGLTDEIAMNIVNRAPGVSLILAFIYEHYNVPADLAQIITLYQVTKQ